jgi:hypothetical protein
LPRCLKKRLNAEPKSIKACSAAHFVTLNTQGNSIGLIALKAFLTAKAVGFKPASYCRCHSAKPQL